jgi:uncharacterized protein
MQRRDYRQQIEQYIRQNAKPADKFSHQARLYRLATRVGIGLEHDDDVLHAAAWLHDLGVFIGHRPEEPGELAKWDCVAYALEQAPKLLDRFGFPNSKIGAVREAIRTHQPSAQPATAEGIILRDADILEQLGAVSILRTVSKVGRDTRFVSFADALRVLRTNANELPGKLRLETSRKLAVSRVQFLQAFLLAADAEADGVDW